MNIFSQIVYITNIN